MEGGGGGVVWKEEEGGVRWREDIFKILETMP